MPGAGMLCCSLRHRGEELLAQNAGVAAYAQRGKTMGIPLLYPWANRLAGFDYSVAGRTVTVPHDPARIALDGNGLPIHGVIGGRLRWELTQRHRAPHRRASLDRATALERVAAAGAVRGVPVPHDLHYEARLAGGAPGGDDRRGCMRRRRRSGGVWTAPLPVAAGAARERYLVELPSMRHLELDAQQIPRRRRSGSCRPGDSSWPSSEFDDGFDQVLEPARFAVERRTRRLELEFVEGIRARRCTRPAPASSSASSR